jgi:hypothetical protein
MEVVIRLNEAQANLIEKALDFYSRIHMGQFHEILNIPIKHTNKPLEHCWGHRGGCEDYLLRALKKELTGMDGEYMGISSKDMPNYVRTCKDLGEVIRNGLAWHYEPNGGMTVNFDRPFHWNKEVPLATIEIKGDTK